MTDLRQAAQQALEALQYASTGNRRPEIIGPAITALKAALEQQAETVLLECVTCGTVYADGVPPQVPVQQQAEPTPWRDMVVVTLVREGVNKHRARELADHFAAQQQAEPVSMRMPKVGDKVICLEDESLGEVVSLTGGGSPDITFEDGTRGTYMLREFAELFGYAEQRQQQAEPPPEWPLIKNILAVFGLDAIAFVAAWKAVQQRAEPVAQRPWVGLTDDEITELDMEISGKTMDECVRAIEDKLKAKNDH